MELLNTMDPQQALEYDIQIIVALMRRMGITEIEIKPEELLKPGELSSGVAIVMTPAGGMVATLIEGEVAEALMDARGQVRQ